MNLEEAKKLKSGDWIHHIDAVNSDGSKQRFKVTSVKTWKTRPEEILIGLKRGLYEYHKIDEYDLHLFEIGWS